MNELIRLARNLIRKWRSQATREEKARQKWTDPLSIEKSYGIELGLQQAAGDLEGVLKKVGESTDAQA